MLGFGGEESKEPEERRNEAGEQESPVGLTRAIPGAPTSKTVPILRIGRPADRRTLGFESAVTQLKMEPIGSILGWRTR